MKEKPSVNIIIWGLSFITVTVLVWILGKYVIMGIMPFILAYGVSLVLRPLSCWLSKKTRVSRKIWAIFLVIVTIGALTLLVVWLVGTLVDESRSLVLSIGKSLENENNIVRRCVDFFLNLRERIPFLSLEGEAVGSVYEGALEILQNSLSELSSFLAAGAAGIIGRLPAFIFALVTVVIAIFYLCLDGGGIREELSVFIGEKNTQRIVSFKKKTVSALSKYLQSYLIIMLLTFSQLLLGFVILDVSYAFLLAFIISVIDLLPVLGSGSVLVPWALFDLIAGKSSTGIGLLILWGVMYLLRQITEPHIIGSVMGIHPLVSLFSIYIGYVFFGIGGVIFLPVAIYLAKAIIVGDDLSEV